MPMQGVDPGIVGSSYQAPMTLQDAENAINWYVEVAEVEGAKEAIALLGTPGLLAIASLAGPAAVVRGLWVLPNGKQMLIVCGNQVSIATITVPPTQTSMAQFNSVVVGTLLTNSGPVYMRDNGVIFAGYGGYVFIVDGTYGYFYAISGTTTAVSFTGGVSTGSPLITLPSVLPTGLLIGTGTVLTDTSSYIPGGTTIVSIQYNAIPFITITMSANATNTNASDTITLTIPVFGQITDSGFLGAQRIAFIEGWLIFNQPGTRTFYTTGPLPYAMTFPGSFYSLKDSSTDNLISLQENNRELWLLGTRTSEVWYNSGNANFAFSRIPGVGPQIGCDAVYGLTRAGSSLYWLAQNEQGENFMVRNNEYTWERISTHAVEFSLAQQYFIEDCIAYSYLEQGHLFVVFTFPTADITWVYDVTSSANAQKPMWHMRASYNPSTGKFHRHLGNCYADFGDLRLVGDYQNGMIYQMSRGLYTDNGATLKAQRRAKHVWKKADRTRVFQSSLQIEFTPGVGLQTGQGQNPQVMIRWSDDGGFTWSNEHQVTIGAAGVTKNRAMVRLMGFARDRVHEVNFTDPVPRDIIGATLFLETEAPT